jgi:hypothetical protein
MKTIILCVAILSTTAAYAEPQSRNPYTTEQINKALVFMGRPEHEQIGRSRVLHDDNAGVTRSETIIKSNRSVTYSIQ